MRDSFFAGNKMQLAHPDIQSTDALRNNHAATSMVLVQLFPALGAIKKLTPYQSTG